MSARPRLAIGVGLLFLIATALGLVKLLLPKLPPEISDKVGDFRNWRPTQAEVAARVGSGTNSRFNDERHLTFARLVQNRFRDNFVPVGVRFVASNRLKLMCGALMPRADMQRIAESVFGETAKVFGSEYTIDLCETNAVSVKKIAELRRVAGRLILVPFEERPAAAALHYSDEIVSFLPRDRIPAVQHPRFVNGSVAKIDPKSRVVGVASGNQARAYSLGLLDGHEIVNDEIDGRKVVISWCSICNSACVYYRRVRGRDLTFAVSGKLWNNAMVMYDKETDSLWSQFTGEAIQGKLKGARLERMNGVRIANWSAWKSLHPNTAALTIKGKEDAIDWTAGRYAADTSQVGFVPIQRLDMRAKPKELVLGLSVDGHSKAYRLSSLESKKLLIDKIGNVETIIWQDTVTGYATAFRSPAIGAYRLEGNAIIGRGKRWHAVTGRSLDGSRDLKEVPLTCSYWFAWSGFHPDTAIM